MIKSAALLLSFAIVMTGAPRAQAAQAKPRLSQARPLSADDQALIDRAIAYLQTLDSAAGRFVQTDARGSVAQGSVALQRPGKARFDYDAPSRLLVVADGRAVSVLDRRLKTFSAYPERSTPLGLFLADRIKLDGGIKITHVGRLSDGFSLTAEDAKRETRGSITLLFTGAPLRLAGWSLVDSRGATTRVQLVDFVRTNSLDPQLFVLRDPRPPTRQR